MVHVSHTTMKRVTAITSYNMVPGKFLCGPIEHLSGPVQYGSQLVLDQYNLEMLFNPR